MYRWLLWALKCVPNLFTKTITIITLSLLLCSSLNNSALRSIHCAVGTSTKMTVLMIWNLGVCGALLNMIQSLFQKHLSNFKGLKPGLKRTRLNTNPEHVLIVKNVIDFIVTPLTSDQLQTLWSLCHWRLRPPVFTQEGRLTNSSESGDGVG